MCVLCGYSHLSISQIASWKIDSLVRKNLCEHRTTLLIFQQLFLNIQGKKGQKKIGALPEKKNSKYFVVIICSFYFTIQSSKYFKVWKCVLFAQTATLFFVNIAIAFNLAKHTLGTIHKRRSRFLTFFDY